MQPAGRQVAGLEIFLVNLDPDAATGAFQQGGRSVGEDLGEYNLPR